MSIQNEIDRITNNVAETYDALEEQGATMPTLKNSNNLAATVRTVSAGSGSGTTVQADLSVNDPSNVRYVKNRTHWKEVFDGPEGEVIAETSVAFTSNIKTITGDMEYGIQVGGKYIVTWDGTDYVCVGKTCSDGNYIGNASFMNAGSISYEDTGEPFLIQQFTGTYYALWKADKTAATVTVKVVGVKETIWHKLDGGYLPEGVPYVESNLVDFLPETTVEIDPDMGAAMFFDVLDIAADAACLVKWNGTEYVCTAQLYGGDGQTGVVLGDLGLITGGTSTGEPFVIMCLDAASAVEGGYGTMAMPLDGSATVTLSISGEIKTVHKMAGELLPEGAPGIEPFDDVIMASFPTANMPDAMFSDPVGAVIAGAVYRVNWGGTLYECVARHQAEEDIFWLGNGYLPNGDDFGTEHPFLIGIFGPASIMVGYGISCTIRTRDTNTEGIKNNFSVVGVYKVQRINEYCMPKNYAPVVVHFDANNNPDVPWGAAYQAIVEGRNVTAYSSKTDITLFQVFGASRSKIIFRAIRFIVDTLYLEQIEWNAPEIAGDAVTTLQKQLTTA